MSNGKNFNKASAAVLVKDITVVEDFSFIVHRVCICAFASIVWLVVHPIELIKCGIFVF